MRVRFQSESVSLDCKSSEAQRETERSARARAENESESESTERITSSQNSFELFADQQPSGHRIQREELKHQTDCLQRF